MKTWKKNVCRLGIETGRYQGTPPRSEILSSSVILLKLRMKLIFYSHVYNSLMKENINMLKIAEKMY